MFETNNDLRLSWLFVEALRAIPETGRAATAQAWFNGTVGGAFLVRFIGTMTGKDSSRSSETIFPDAKFDSLRALATATIRAMSKETDFLKKPRAASLLFTWGHLAGFEEVSAWLKDQIKGPTAVLELAAVIPSEVYSTPGGLWYEVDRKGWSLLLDVDKFTERLREVAKKLPPDEVATAVVNRYEEALVARDSH